MHLIRNKSVTLVELIIAIILVAVIILGINSINIFSNYHLNSSDRRARIQNDASLCLEHIAKEASQAVGNERANGADSVVDIVDDVSVAIFVDANLDGAKGAGDYWVKYKLCTNSLRFISSCSDSNTCNPCSGSGSAVNLSSKITAFTPSKTANFADGNHFTVRITSRWDPTTAVSQDNPELTMQATIDMPSVSTN